MKITLRVYATLCQYIPESTAGNPITLELPEGATLADLINTLQIPAKEVKVAFVNGRTRPSDWVLVSGDEVGIFPPVGGG